MQPSSKTPRMAIRSASSPREPPPDAPRPSGSSADASRSRTWRRVVLDRARLDPARDRVVGEGVGQVLAPDRAVGAAHLRQRRVDVEHPDEARPLAAPVGDGQDRPAMAAQPGEDVMAVLPDRLGDDERRVAVDAREDVHAHALAGDEAVARAGIDRMRPADGRAVTRERGRDVSPPARPAPASPAGSRSRAGRRSRPGPPPGVERSSACLLDPPGTPPEELPIGGRRDPDVLLEHPREVLRAAEPA